MFFPAPLSITLGFSLILPASAPDMASVMAQEQVTPMVAAGSRRTVGLKSDGTVVATGLAPATELAKWNLVLVVPPMNWPLIGGIIAAVVAVGLGIFFVRRRGRGPADTRG